MFDRLATRDVVSRLYGAFGVTLHFLDGRITATPKTAPMPEGARALIRAHKEDLLRYLTEPPKTANPCAACGRNDVWELDSFCIWTCNCYKTPGLQTWPKPVAKKPKPKHAGHGFYSDGVLHLGSERIACELPTTCEGFLDIALDNGLSHVWIMPDVAVCPLAGTVEDGREKLVTDTHDILLNRKKVGTKLIGSLVGRGRKPHTDNVRVIFVSETAWAQDLQGLQEAIKEVEGSLGIEMQASATTVGLRYLEKIDKRYHARYFEKIEKIDWETARTDFKAAAHSLMWHRQPHLQERSCRYLVAYDKRSAYPRAAKEESFGIGQPEFQEKPTFNHLLPGIWHCNVSGLNEIDSRLPSPLWKSWENPGWLATGIVKLLLKLGATVKIDQSITWPTYAPVFDRWAGSLWDLRQKSSHPEAIKPILNNTLGFTLNGDSQDDSTFRPDWHMTIVASTRAALIYNAMTVAKESGMYPIGAYIDALYFCSDTPTIPGYLEKHADSLGGYAHKWTLDLQQTVGEARNGVRTVDQLVVGASVLDLLDSKMSWAYQLQILNRLAGVEDQILNQLAEEEE